MTLPEMFEMTRILIQILLGLVVCVGIFAAVQLMVDTYYAMQADRENRLRACDEAESEMHNDVPAVTGAPCGPDESWLADPVKRAELRAILTNGRQPAIRRTVMLDAAGAEIPLDAKGFFMRERATDPWRPAQSAGAVQLNAAVLRTEAK